MCVRSVYVEDARGAVTFTVPLIAAGAVVSRSAHVCVKTEHKSCEGEMKRRVSASETESVKLTAESVGSLRCV